MSAIIPFRIHLASRRFAPALALGALLAALFTASSAQALPAFDSLNGNFTFTNFFVSGSTFAQDRIDIVATDNGFEIIMNDGAMSVGPGEGRDLVIQYDVISHIGGIVSASLSMLAETRGLTALAVVSEDYFTEVGGDLIDPGLTVYSTYGMSSLFDIQDIGGLESLHVKKDIQVSGIFEGFADISKVSQDFFVGVIPEPSAALLFAAGAGLISTRLRRRGSHS